MIFGRKGRERLLDAPTGFEAAVREQDADGCERGFQEAGDDEARALSGGGDLPDPESDALDDAVLDRVGPKAAVAWWTLPQWEMASVAMLNHASVRTGAGAEHRPRLLAALHTLLADVPVGGGHLPGRAPSAQEAAVCGSAPGQVPATGSFNLLAPDGTCVWNEGTPGACRRAARPPSERHRTLRLTVRAPEHGPQACVRAVQHPHIRSPDGGHAPDARRRKNCCGRSTVPGP